MTTIKSFEGFLDRMQGLLDEAKKQGRIIVRVEDLENAFPELRESEGERVRKWLIRDIKQSLDDNVYNDENIDSAKEALAWLEKQDQASDQKEVRKIEQKPAWSEDDEHYYGIIQYILNNECVGKTDKENAFNWFKSLKDRVQPKQEWSEEDSKMVEDIVKNLKKYQLQMPDYRVELQMRWINHLKFIYTWQPSDEQIEALEKTLKYFHMLNAHGKTIDGLKELLEQLKKLRG